MNKITNINHTSPLTDLALLAARIGIAALMLTHGIPKMIMLFSGEPVKFPPVLGMTAGVSLGLAVFAEVLCSVLVLAGIATRIFVVPLIITMLVAIVSIHATDAIGVKEPALHYLLVYIVLLLAGSGKYSVDYFLQSKRVTLTNEKIQKAPVAIYQ